jgi:hypothetical protein
MDYAFYGAVTISQETNKTTVSLRITCEPDETIELYSLSPSVFRRLTYKKLSSERQGDHLTTQFDAPSDMLILLILRGKSNESSNPFEVAYAVYNGEVISLPQNDLVSLAGTTYIFID